MSTSSPITTRPHVTEFTREFVQPPTNLFIDPDDRLYVEHVSRFVSLAFHVAARVLKPGGQGEIIHEEFGLQTAPVGAQFRFEVFPLLEGFLLGVVVHPTFLVTGPGDLYVLVGLLRGNEVRQSATQILCAGYVVGPSGPSWPAGGIESLQSGRGATSLGFTVDPGAGVEISHTVGDLRRGELRAMRFTLVTDATVANRRVLVEVVRSGNIIARTAAALVQTASLTFNYNVAPWGESGDNRNGEILVNFPPGILLSSGDIIRTVTPGLQAGDNYSAALVTMEDWLAEF